MKSFMASPSTIERKWYVVDATGHTLGRLASEVAKVLRGKNKPIFTPHIDTGDYVIVVNADKIKVSGNKMNDKIYYSHSDYVGGLKSRTLKEMLEKKPEAVVEHAVKGMLQTFRIRRSGAQAAWSAAGSARDQVLRVGGIGYGKVYKILRNR